MNDEIEANFQITREIESEIVKCSEFERALASSESELMKTDGLIFYPDMVIFFTLQAKFRMLLVIILSSFVF